MKKEYRIVEVKVYTLSQNTEGIVDFIPEITEKVTYSIDYRFITKIFFVFTNSSNWQVKSGGYSSIAQAEAVVEYLKKEIIRKEVKRL